MQDTFSDLTITLEPTADAMDADLFVTPATLIQVELRDGVWRVRLDNIYLAEQKR